MQAEMYVLACIFILEVTEMDVKEILSQHYENYDEDGRLTTRYGRVEYLTTMRYLNRYLSPGMRILEIGAATGRYSHELARMGYQVDAVELVEHNIQLFRANTQQENKSLSPREMRQTFLSFWITPMILLCCWGLCTIYLLMKRNCKH